MFMLHYDADNSSLLYLSHVYVQLTNSVIGFVRAQVCSLLLQRVDRANYFIS
jgi:hypothetical protein